MIDTLICSNGMTFSTTNSYAIPVDKLIDFLDQYRGITFYNAASGDVAFRVEGETLICDSQAAHISRAYDMGNGIGELAEVFFTSGFENETA